MLLFLHISQNRCGGFVQENDFSFDLDIFHYLLHKSMQQNTLSAL